MQLVTTNDIEICFFAQHNNTGSTNSSKHFKVYLVVNYCSP